MYIIFTEEKYSKSKKKAVMYSVLFLIAHILFSIVFFSSFGDNPLYILMNKFFNIKYKGLLLVVLAIVDIIVLGFAIKNMAYYVMLKAKKNMLEYEKNLEEEKLK